MASPAGMRDSSANIVGPVSRRRCRSSLSLVPSVGSSPPAFIQVIGTPAVPTRIIGSSVAMTVRPYGRRSLSVPSRSAAAMVASVLNSDSPHGITYRRRCRRMWCRAASPSSNSRRGSMPPFQQPQALVHFRSREAGGPKEPRPPARGGGGWGVGGVEILAHRRPDGESISVST